MDSIKNGGGVEAAPKEDLLSYLELLSFSTKTVTETVTIATATTTVTPAVTKTDEEIAAE
jgi:hypothetical protein